MSEAVRDMDRIGDCVASSNGIEIEPEYVNGGFFSETPAGGGTGTVVDVQTAIAACTRDVYGSARLTGPTQEDIGLVYEMYVAQASCLAARGYPLQSAPTEDDFAADYQSDITNLWQPLYAAGDDALAGWAVEHGVDEQAAYESLLTDCPDPIRMWAYVSAAPQEQASEAVTTTSP